MLRDRKASFAFLGVVSLAGFALCAGGAASGCSSFGADALDDGETTDDAGDQDASDDGAAPLADAGEDAPPPACDLEKPFGAPATVAFPAKTGRQIFRVFADELAVLFQANDPETTEGLDAFFVTRPNPGAPFGPVLPLSLNTVDNEGNAAATFDGSLLFFTSNRGPGGDYDLYYVKRHPNGTLDSAVELSDIDSDMDDDEPWPSRDGLELWFTSNRESASGVDSLYVAHAATPGKFSTFTEASELTSGAGDENAVLSWDGRTIWYSTRRGGPSWDVWTATRAAPGAMFAPPAPFDVANTENDDERPSGVSADGCRMYFERQSTVTGATDLLVVERPK